MIDKIKEYIGEAQAFSTQNKEELEAFRIKFLTIIFDVGTWCYYFTQIFNYEKWMSENQDD